MPLLQLHFPRGVALRRAQRFAPGYYIPAPLALRNLNPGCVKMLLGFWMNIIRRVTKHRNPTHFGRTLNLTMTADGLSQPTSHRS